MKDKGRISEHEHQGRFESLLKSAFNTQLQPLRSLQTATKKRRAQKKDDKQFWIHETNDDDFRLMVRPPQKWILIHKGG
jgi:ribosomal protein L20